MCVTLTVAYTSQTWWLQIPFFGINPWSQVNPSTAHCWLLLYRLHRTALLSGCLSSCLDYQWSYQINYSWSEVGWGADEDRKAQKWRTGSGWESGGKTRNWACSGWFIQPEAKTWPVHGAVTEIQCSNKVEGTEFANFFLLIWPTIFTEK